MKNLFIKARSNASRTHMLGIVWCVVLIVCCCVINFSKTFAITLTPNLNLPKMICGNGIISINEQCDDGNIVNGDGCSSSCTTEQHILPQDICPNGDLSPFLYDGTCLAPSTGNIVLANTWSESSNTTNTWSDDDNELYNAYQYAYTIGITTMPTIEQANIYGNLIRSHMAKMMTNYAIEVIGLTLDTWANCVFDDIANESAELQWYIKKACQLHLMGVGINNFNPKGEVTRAEFGTVLSRVLWWGQYNGGTPYYLNHLAALKTAAIISNNNPSLKETRGYVMLMLMRADK